MQDTQEIWDEHIAIGDNGIAYHRIIKGDGTTVQGRPDGTVGAHALNVNQISVGIVLEGDFQSTESQEKPTDAQISALKNNLNDLLIKYPNVKIIGHRDVADITNDPSVATACPGDSLYQLLPTIIKSL
jgi:N-acetyl-anhydromuramyl-L-alanine amidase AmpD